MNLDLKIWLKECISNLAQLTLGSFEVISGQNISVIKGLNEIKFLNTKKVAVDHDRCEKIQELSENVDKLKTLMKKNLGKFYN